MFIKLDWAALSWHQQDIYVMHKTEQGSSMYNKTIGKWASIRMSYSSLNGLFPVILMIYFCSYLATLSVAKRLRRDKYLFE